MKKFLLFVFLLSLLQLNGQNITDSLKNCLLSKQVYQLDEDLFAIYTKYENSLIKGGYLKDNTKGSYNDLMNKILNDANFKVNRADIKVSNDNYNQLINPVIIAAQMQCYGKVIEKAGKKLKKKAPIRKQNAVLQEIIADKSISNYELNTKLINSIDDKDFSDMIYRSSVLSIIIQLIDYNYFKQ